MATLIQSLYSYPLSLRQWTLNCDWDSPSLQDVSTRHPSMSRNQYIVHSIAISCAFKEDNLPKKMIPFCQNFSETRELSLFLFCVCEDFSVSSRWFLLRRKKRDREALIKNEWNNEGGWLLLCFFPAGKLLFLGGPKHLGTFYLYDISFCAFSMQKVRQKTYRYYVTLQ